MVDIRQRILAEMENIETVLAHLPGIDQLPTLTALELAGVAAFLHSFYNGVENILKQVVADKGVKVADGATWHRDLLNDAVSSGVLSSVTRNDLAEYLAFRHFFSHGYAVDLESERLGPLVVNVSNVYSSFKQDMKPILNVDG